MAKRRALLMLKLLRELITLDTTLPGRVLHGLTWLIWRGKGTTHDDYSISLEVYYQACVPMKMYKNSKSPPPDLCSDCLWRGIY